MKVKIGKLEITLENMDELDELINRYGDDIAVEGGQQSSQSVSRQGRGILDNRDRVVLQTLLAAGTTGVQAAELGKMLGKRGRGLRGAAQRWAKRIGLTEGDEVNPFEETRIGTQRGLRLDAAYSAIAKGLT